MTGNTGRLSVGQWSVVNFDEFLGFSSKFTIDD